MSERIMPRWKLFCAKNAKKNKYALVTAKAKGKTVVACTAAAEDWFKPMKKKEKAEVEGRPPRIPPTTLPFFSAMTVIAVTHRLPTANARRRCRKTEESIIGLTFHYLLAY
jgi:hypothetical protein